MFSRGIGIGSLLVCLSAIPLLGGCANCRTGDRGPGITSKCSRARGGACFSRSDRKPDARWNGNADRFERSSRVQRTRMRNSSSRCELCQRPGCEGCGNKSARGGRTVSFADLPSGAGEGECFAPVYLPPRFDTVTERIRVKEGFEKIEIIPAEYEWVEERVMIKDASTELVAVQGEFEQDEQVVETSPAYSTWMKANPDRCSTQMAGPQPQDIFCFVSEPPSSLRLQTERMVKPPSVKEVSLPAEFQTVRKQKLVRPASTRRVAVPAEYREFEKTVMVSPGRVEWQRVTCDPNSLRMGAQVRPVRDNNP